jgi:MoxR-like ATPase
MAQEHVRQVAIADPMMAYIAALVEATHAHDEFITGVSVRGGLALMRAAQAAAYLAGRDAVYPDDIKRLFPHVAGHRLAWRNRSRKSDGHVRLVLREILATVPVP